MKKFYLSVLIGLTSFAATGQSFSVDDLVSLTGFPNSKFDSYVARKGYKSLSFVSNDSLAYSYYDKKAKEVHPDDFILKSTTSDRAIIAYQTTSLDDFNSLQEELKQEGFDYAPNSGEHLLYQKGSITVKPVKKKEGEKTVYCFVVEKKDPAKGKGRGICRGFPADHFTRIPGTRIWGVQRAERQFLFFRNRGKQVFGSVPEYQYAGDLYLDGRGQ